MPEGRNQAFLCLSFASHEGRRRVRVNGHILALSRRGQAQTALILYCQAVLLTFFNIVIFSLLLYYSDGYYYYYYYYYDNYYYFSYHCSEPRSFCFLHFYQLLICCSSFFYKYIILEAGERHCSTPVQFLHCSLPLTGLSPQQGPAVQFIFTHFKKEDRKHDMDLYIL